MGINYGMLIHSKPPIPSSLIIPILSLSIFQSQSHWFSPFATLFWILLASYNFSSIYSERVDTRDKSGEFQSPLIDTLSFVDEADWNSGRSKHSYPVNSSPTSWNCMRSAWKPDNVSSPSTNFQTILLSRRIRFCLAAMGKSWWHLSLWNLLLHLKLTATTITPTSPQNASPCNT